MQLKFEQGLCPCLFFDSFVNSVINLEVSEIMDFRRNA